MRVGLFLAALVLFFGAYLIYDASDAPPATVAGGGTGDENGAALALDTAALPGELRAVVARYLQVLRELDRFSGAPGHPDPFTIAPDDPYQIAARVLEPPLADFLLAHQHMVWDPARANKLQPYWASGIVEDQDERVRRSVSASGTEAVVEVWLVREDGGPKTVETWRLRRLMPEGRWVIVGPTDGESFARLRGLPDPPRLTPYEQWHQGGGPEPMLWELPNGYWQVRAPGASFGAFRPAGALQRGELAVWVFLVPDVPIGPEGLDPHWPALLHRFHEAAGQAGRFGTSIALPAAAPAWAQELMIGSRRVLWAPITAQAPTRPEAGALYGLVSQGAPLLAFALGPPALFRAEHIQQGLRALLDSLQALPADQR